MAKSDDIEKLPLPKSWPKPARRALVLVNSMLKVSLDIELGRRLDCAVPLLARPERMPGILDLQNLGLVGIVWPSCTIGSGHIKV